jgi:hypothetical protein
MLQPYDKMQMRPVGHCIELVLATAENTVGVGCFIDDDSDISVAKRIPIPFYARVTEGGIFNEAEWHDPVVRIAKIKYNDNHQILWLECHMKTRLVGQNPGLLVLGEPTHDRT